MNQTSIINYIISIANVFQCRIVWGLRLWLPKQHRIELLLRMDWSDPQAYSTVNWYPWYIRCWHAFMDFWYVAIGTFFQLWVQDIVTFYLDFFQALLRWSSFHPRRSCARRLAIRSLVDYAADFACRSFLAVQWLQCQCVQGAQYACSPIQQGIYCLCNYSFRGEYHVLCVSGEIRQHLLNICLGMRSDMTWYDLTPDCTSRLWVMPPCEWHWTTGTGAQSQGKSFGHFQCTRFLHGCVWKWLVPLNPMVNDHYPYEKWLFPWEYTLFSDKPTCQLQYSAMPHCSKSSLCSKPMMERTSSSAAQSAVRSRTTLPFRFLGQKLTADHS